MGRLKGKAKLFFTENRNVWKHLSLLSSEKFTVDHTAAELIRNTHSIEKGLSISEPRLGFGHDKQKQMLQQIRVLMGWDETYYREVSQMALDSLYSYLHFHDGKGYSDACCDEIRSFISEFAADPNCALGGTIWLKKGGFDLRYQGDRILLQIKAQYPGFCRYQGRRCNIKKSDKSCSIRSIRMQQAGSQGICAQ